jgi:hypothetical protein
MMVSRDSSIVEVAGLLAPGAGEGSRFDVQVRPLDSATSLENGYLHWTGLTPTIQKDGTTTRGREVAHASGQVSIAAQGPSLVIGAGGNPREGTVFDGGRFDTERVLLIRMQDRYVSGQRTVLIEYLLNRRFSGVGRGPGESPVLYASAESGKTVYLEIPQVYKAFTVRFADVVKAVRGEYYYGPPSQSVMDGYARTLASGKPEEKYRASVELETIGATARDHLEAAQGDGWTLLYTGEALSYLNSELGRTRIIAAAESGEEAVRYEAVKFLGQMSGRNVVQALRTKVFDQSNRISMEAIAGLVFQGNQYASTMHLPDYDLVAVLGVSPGLVVKPGGRPMVAVLGVGAAFVGQVAVNIGNVGIASTDQTHVAVISGLSGQPEQVVVDATMDNVLGAMARYNVPFDTVRRVITALEDAGNVPYKISWID